MLVYYELAPVPNTVSSIPQSFPSACSQHRLILRAKKSLVHAGQRNVIINLNEIHLIWWSLNLQLEYQNPVTRSVVNKKSTVHTVVYLCLVSNYAALIMNFISFRCILLKGLYRLNVSTFRIFLGFVWPKLLKHFPILLEIWRENCSYLRYVVFWSC